MSSHADEFESAADGAYKYRKVNDVCDCPIRTEVETRNTVNLLAAQTRYLAALQTETNNALKQVVSRLDTNNELLLQLLQRMQGAGEK